MIARSIRSLAETCRKIADLCESTGGGICVHDMRHVQNDQLFVFGYQPEFLEKLGTFAQSPMAAADIVANVGDVKLSMDRHELLESRFYRGCAQAVRTPWTSSGFRRCGPATAWPRCMPRGATRRALPAARDRLFKLLSPHVCRASPISDALDIRTLRSEMLEKTLDALAAGVFLTAAMAASST